MSRHRWIWLLAGLTCLIPATAYANAGLPMFSIEYRPMLIALCPIIVLEAILFAKRLPISSKRAAVGSTIANVVSTVVGIPLAWGVLMLLEFVSYKSYAMVEAGSPIKALTLFLVQLFQIAWLPPLERGMEWMIPAALIALLIPNYFVTVAIERPVLVMIFSSVDKRAVVKAVWRTNAISYGLLFLVGLGYLIFTTW